MANNIGYTFGSKPDYTVGNIVLTAGSKNFTVTDGANLQAANILPGFTILHPNGKALVIATITSATSGTLKYNCPSDCGGTIETLIRYQSEGSSLSAAVRDLLSSITSGLLSSISSLSMTKGMMIVGDDIAGTVKLVDMGRLENIRALSLSANQVIVGNGGNNVKAVTLNTDNVTTTTTNQYVTAAEKDRIANSVQISRNFAGRTANDVLEDSIFYGQSTSWFNTANGFPETAYGTLTVHNIVPTDNAAYPRAMQELTTQNGNLWLRFINKTATGIDYGTWTNLNRLKTDNLWTASNTFQSNAGNQLNPIKITGPSGAKVFHRIDDNGYYILLGGATDTSFNTLRPFSVNLTSGAITSRNGLTATGGFTTDNATVSGNLNASAANLTNLLVGLKGEFVATNAPSGWLKANGGEVNRAAFPRLWAYAQASGALVSEAEWSNGRQGCYSVGNGTSTFRLPDLRGMFIRGLDDGRGVDSGRTVGSEQGDTIRNITGEIHALWAVGQSASGAFSSNITDANRASGGTDRGQFSYYFDASRVVPTASENRPRNTALLFCIRFQ